MEQDLGASGRGSSIKRDGGADGEAGLREELGYSSSDTGRDVKMNVEIDAFRRGWQEVKMLYTWWSRFSSPK